MIKYKQIIQTINYSTKRKIKIVEVGPRDGLQNVATFIPTETKIQMINELSNSGLQSIEVTSFVSPKWIPQFKDSKEVLSKINKKPEISYPVLVPNLIGMEKAIESKVNEVAIFSAASESFTKKNINCTIKESIQQFQKVVELANKHSIKVRGYLSCVIACPYEGNIDPKICAEISKELLDMGCYEISLGDTIGVGTPGSFDKLLNEINNKMSFDKVAVHCHDTYGQALANIQYSVDAGVSVIDSSVGGLGGCPYAKGATGNVATEDVVYMLEGIGYTTGLNLESLIRVSDKISKFLNISNASKVATAFLKKANI